MKTQHLRRKGLEVKQRNVKMPDVKRQLPLAKLCAISNGSVV
jgi:hypothetical protein